MPAYREAQIDDLEKRIEILEDHEKVNVEDMTDMYNQIRELKLYGNSVYEAIRMLSEDYTSKESGRTALYNGILSKLDKYDFVSQAISQPQKQEKWIVHRTLRKQNKEVYVSLNHSGFGLGKWISPFESVELYSLNDKTQAKAFYKDKAIKIRDDLNKDRVGKQYLWVISKVEEK